MGLSSLDLRHCSQISDTGVQALASGCPGLGSSDLHYCSQNSGIGVQALASGCPELAASVLRYYSQISGIGVQALASGGPGPASLNLAGTAISDIGVQAVASDCPGLTTLWLCDCAELQQEILRQQGQRQEPDALVMLQRAAALDLPQWVFVTAARALTSRCRP